MKNSSSKTLDKICYSVKEFAELTSLSKSTIYNLMNNNSLSFRKIGRRRVIMAKDGLDFLNEIKQNQIKLNENNQDQDQAKSKEDTQNQTILNENKTEKTKSDKINKSKRSND